MINETSYELASQRLKENYLLIIENKYENGIIESFWVSKNSSPPIKLTKCPDQSIQLKLI